jgi:16S rRNA (guanine527-N7)-methyltransferase
MFHVKQRALKYSGLIDFLLQHNKNINLTAIRDHAGAMSKHIEDSLVASDHIKLSLRETKTVLDIGTGAGFPGLIIAAENPEIIVTLIDSTAKKIKYVNEAIRYMGLSNCLAFADRAESFALKNKGAFDAVIARSVARLDALLEYASPLLKLDGYLLAMKSNKSGEELDLGQYVARLYGFAPAIITPYTLLDQNRAIISFKKTGKSGFDLPRKIGAAVNDPIQRRN